MNSIHDQPASGPDQWLDTHGDYLFRYAMIRVQNETIAEDLVQETLLAALTASRHRTGNANERTWLTSILKHKIVDQFRRTWREQPLEGDIPANVPDEPGLDEFFAEDGHWADLPSAWGQPYRSLEQRHFFEVLQTCIQRLSPRLSEIFVLKEFDEMSNEELCKELGVSTTNVWVMLYRARMGLRQCLETRWFENDRGAR